MKKYVIALDQGTSSSRAIVFDHEGNALSVSQKEFTQHFPQPGWVEHDPMEIWATESGVMMEAVATLGAEPDEIAAIGITNQRETTVVFFANYIITFGTDMLMFIYIIFYHILFLIYLYHLLHP